MKNYLRAEITPLEAVTISPDKAPATLEAAYAEVKARTQEADFVIAAWKLGGTTAAAQKALGIDALFFAPLHKKEVLSAPSIAPGFEVIHLKTEAEVALRISQQGADLIAKGIGALEEAELTDLFDGWCYAFEMPSPTLANASDFGVRGIVADRCAAACLALGQVHPYDSNTRWDDIALVLLENGKELARGNTSDLINSADICARDFLVLALQTGFSPQQGHWIATGGMIPATALTKGAQLALTANGDTVLDLTVGW